MGERLHNELSGVELTEVWDAFTWCGAPAQMRPTESPLHGASLYAVVADQITHCFPLPDFCKLYESPQSLGCSCFVMAEDHTPLLS